MILKPSRIIIHDPIPGVDTPKEKGLGDFVHAALFPAVRVIDATLKTDLQNCVPCNTTRVDALNKLGEKIKGALHV